MKKNTKFKHEVVDMDRLIQEAPLKKKTGKAKEDREIKKELEEENKLIHVSNMREKKDKLRKIVFS
jgi:hypothetical protein